MLLSLLLFGVSWGAFLGIVVWAMTSSRAREMKGLHEEVRRRRIRDLYPENYRR